MQRLENKFGSHRDGRFQSAIHRAKIGKEPMHAVSDFSLRLLSFQFQYDMNPANHQHVVF
jgi:hypothetical protein